MDSGASCFLMRAVLAIGTFLVLASVWPCAVLYNRALPLILGLPPFVFAMAAITATVRARCAGGVLLRGSIIGEHDYPPRPAR